LLPGIASGITGPIGLGFRVPTIVVSPFSRGGRINSDVFDHTSLLRFLETRFGVEVPNLSAWRRNTVGDLTSTLDLAHPRTDVPKLPFDALDPKMIAKECKNVERFASPPDHQELPHQER
jgi:phospholipase C